MNKEEDHASDSEESDEDFCPTGEQSDAGSEEESEEASDAENQEEEEEDEKNSKSASKKRNKRKKYSRKNGKKSKVDNHSEEEDNLDVSSRRQTRGGELLTSKKSIEKDSIESDEEDKGRSDSLWAAFLSDVKTPTSASKATTTTSTQAKSKETSSTSTSASNSSDTKTTNGDDIQKKSFDKAKSSEEKEKVTSPSLVTVTEVVDFAGEAVSIQKTVKADSIKENQSSVSKKNPAKPIPPTLKRPAIGGIGGGGGGGGLGSILNQIGKKKKISVLEKSKLDWNSFKQTEGIEEELQTFNKGKDGYLERQDFLQRTDLRQFEIEKSLRQSRRN